MQLLDYMRRENLDDAAMAARINAARINAGVPAERHCTLSAVKKWKYRERSPDADRIIDIQRATNDEVGLQDWASEPAEARS